MAGASSPRTVFAPVPRKIKDLIRKVEVKGQGVRLKKPVDQRSALQCLIEKYYFFPNTVFPINLIYFQTFNL